MGGAKKNTAFFNYFNLQFINFKWRVPYHVLGIRSPTFGNNYNWLN